MNALRPLASSASKWLPFRRALTTTPGNANAWMFSSDKAKTSGHSKLLTDNQSVYEVVSDTVAPKDWDAYLQHKGTLLALSGSKEAIRAEHVASWNFVHGDIVFRALHLIRYNDGWSDVDRTRAAMKTDAAYQKEHRAGLQLIKQQSNEFFKGFAYWPAPDKRTSSTGNNIYDVRCYQLKPGSMYDWGNYWAKGIRCRTRVRDDIPYAGLFTQLGNLHTIYHIWVYADLEDRKNCREGTWDDPEWNDVVQNTVPLIRTMSTRILEPLPFSPTQ
jgi:hypothetical protein